MQLEVPTALSGVRADRCLALLSGLSRSQVARLIKEGGARLAGQRLDSGSRRLRTGELLEVQLPAAEPIAAQLGPVWGTGESRIVHADEDVVVVDKPAGVVVHPGAGNSTQTLVQQLLFLFPDIVSAGPPERPGIVHRLDKGTSGLLVVARTQAARLSLATQIQARTVERLYLGVVHGELPAEDGVVDAPLGRSYRKRTRMAVVEGGRPAITRYKVLSRSAHPLATCLLSIRLESGRTHQIRVHMAAIGHPVVGDERYGTAVQLAAAKAHLSGLGRPWLHAARLSFSHPGSGLRMSFESPPPPELVEALVGLGLGLPDSPAWP